MGSRNQRALSWLNFFVAAAETGFGAFVPAYLAAQSWGQTEIGAVLSVGTLTAMFSQVPAGALVDVIRRRRVLLGAAMVIIGAAALILVVLPMRWPVLIALVLQSVASSVMAPGIAAISLVLSGSCGVGERMGRNSQFAAVGGIVGAALLGAVGTLISERTVFVLTAALALPTLYALHGSSRGVEQVHPDAAGCLPEHEAQPVRPLALLRDRPILAFASCVFLFFLSNAAVVPTAIAAAAQSGAPFSAMMIAAFIIVPQLVVAAASLQVGRSAERIGRRPLLVLGFASLPLRAMLFAIFQNPLTLFFVQPLEGLGAAVFGVMLPLIAADLTRGTGRYNLCLGLLGLVGTLGAAASTSFAGVVADLWGGSVAFWVLAVAGLAALTAVLWAMPETQRPAAPSASEATPQAAEPAAAVATERSHGVAG
jgi:MFS family permease